MRTGAKVTGSVKLMLVNIPLEPERVAQFQVAIDEYDKIPQMLQEFMGIIEGLGPNPFKGF
jgi:quinone-modifying oxidoreductase subunit QmoB